MEACCGAHHLGRILVAQGYDVRLIPPQYVKPFVKSQKNDLRAAFHRGPKRSPLHREAGYINAESSSPMMAACGSGASFAEDSRRRVYAGELEVRPPDA